MCPSCCSKQISRSRNKKFADRFMLWLGKTPYRCRECNKRFYIEKEVAERGIREEELRQSVELEQRLNRPEPDPIVPHNIAK